MTNVTVRLDASTMRELDALTIAATERNTLGTVTRSDVLRAALADFISAHAGKGSDHEHGKSHARVRIRR